jgi:hypothetical protein
VGGTTSPGLKTIPSLTLPYKGEIIVWCTLILKEKSMRPTNRSYDQPPRLALDPGVAPSCACRRGDRMRPGHVRCWHLSDMSACLRCGCYQGKSGSDTDIYSSVAEDENHVRLVTALKSGRLSGECGLGMRIGCERPVANSKLLLERNLLEGRLLKTGAYCG